MDALNKKLRSWLDRAAKHAAMGTVVFGVIAALVFSAPAAMAQSSTGTFLGTVKDPSGQSVPETKVTARNLDTGATRTVTTGEDGSFRMPELPIGNYEIRSEHEGFSAQVVNG